MVKICKECGRKGYGRKGDDPKNYICKVCRSKVPTTIPTGIASRCITCRLEFMRVEGGPLQCPRCDAIRKHNLSKVGMEGLI